MAFFDANKRYAKARIISRERRCAGRVLRSSSAPLPPLFPPVVCPSPPRLFQPFDQSCTNTQQTNIRTVTAGVGTRLVEALYATNLTELVFRSVSVVRVCS